MRARLPMIFSITALLVAVLGATPLGRAAYDAVLPKNSVGTKQLQRNAVKAAKIAPNAVRTGHVLNGSLLAEDFKAGQLPQGPKGDKGEKGDKGDKGDPGLTEYEIVKGTFGASAFAGKNAVSFYVDCPPDKRILGGGGATPSSLNVAVTAEPIYAPNTSRPYRLYVHAWEVVADPNAWTVDAQAVCAKAQ